MRRNFLSLVLIVFLFLSFACSQGPENTTQPQEQTTITGDITEEQAREQLTTYLHENFGGAGNPEYATSWYNSIENIRLELEPDGRANVIVNTDYIAGKKDKIAENIAKSIAAAIVGNRAIDVKSVTVFGQNGTIGSWSYFK